MGGERILVVDDDEHISKALGMYLRHEGLEVESRNNGTQGLSALAERHYDLVLLDLDMPDIDGFTVLERAREGGDVTPVIIISGHDEEYNKLVGLDVGADDYVVKPFSMPLLVSKIRALLRRNGVYSGQTQATESSQDILVRGPFQLVRSSLRLTKNGAPLTLTAKELALFTIFLENPDRVFTKEQLYRTAWNTDFVDENTVMVYIKRLRDKVEDDPSNPTHLKTLRGMGYSFTC